MNLCHGMDKWQFGIFLWMAEVLFGSLGISGLKEMVKEWWGKKQQQKNQTPFALYTFFPSPLQHPFLWKNTGTVLKATVTLSSWSIVILNLKVFVTLSPI